MSLAIEYPDGRVIGRNPFNQVTSKKCGASEEFYNSLDGRNPFNQVTSKKWTADVLSAVLGIVVIPLIRSQVKNQGLTNT